MTEPQKKHPKLILEDHLTSISEKKNKALETKNKETKTYANLIDSISDMESKTDLLKLNAERIHLSETCISYVHDWLKQQPEFYGRSSNFRSKYTDKGNECEDDSIELASEYFGWGLVQKNTVRIVNDYIEGEADVVLRDSIEDIKNSWSEKTFPLFAKDIPIDGYGWQLQGYMELYDRNKSGLIYTLMDTPERLVHKEAMNRMYELGLDDLDAELYDEVKESMTFSQFPIELRVKRFGLDRDRSLMDRVKYRVDDIRKYIEQL